MTDNTTMDNRGPLLLGAKATATMLGIGKSLLWSLHSAGKVPQPVKLGKRTLWRRAELEAWMAAGCPNRDKWLAMQPSSRAG